MVTVGDADGKEEGYIVGDWDGWLGRFVGMMEGNNDGTAVGVIVMVGAKLDDGVPVGRREIEGATVGDVEGDGLGALVSVGNKDGKFDGLVLGDRVVVGSGDTVGIRDGHALGKSDGVTEGVSVGCDVTVGRMVIGTDVGISEVVGSGVVVGLCVGTFEVDGIGVNVVSVKLVIDGYKLGLVDKMEGMGDIIGVAVGELVCVGAGVTVGIEE